MGLVDYSSDSSEPEDVNTPQVKRQKTSDKRVTTGSTTKSELPPLPPAFHDLYASTVRVSASDDPTLHQGRKRVNPHKVGHWPSHLYIEWHPTPRERETLTQLLSTLRTKLTSQPPSPAPTPVISLLTSDLNAPQPLHISLSRPIVLGTAQREPFAADLGAGVRASRVAPFDLRPAALEWHRTPESARSFLVLRVAEAGADPKGKTTTLTTTTTTITTSSNNNNNNNNSNPRLAALLRRANAVVTARGQPALYAAVAAGGKDNSGSGVHDAFHVSIAWSPATPDPELRRLTEAAFAGPAPGEDGDGDGDGDRGDRGDRGDGGSPTPAPATSFRDVVGAMRVRVDGVKAKIGNVVTHLPLPDARVWGREGEGGGGGGGLLGI
ncbi:putative protein family UPF0406 [Rosellinia necatrix]|uniref:U6 snRNA phosphodiesterase n=1 Tax=Rosellinia necatrix TaxID=77044 RepID=A0A1W2TBQ1_ROSNE|nr:putative protein family UPF0406 [Rosellinia necatrix]